MARAPYVAALLSMARAPYVYVALLFMARSRLGN